MTEWQWRVLIALVRYVLRKDKISIPSMYDVNQSIEDCQVLIAAVEREKS